jgi:hypothetical protein
LWASGLQHVVGIQPKPWKIYYEVCKSEKKYFVYTQSFYFILNVDYGNIKRPKLYTKEVLLKIHRNIAAMMKRANNFIPLFIIICSSIRGVFLFKYLRL